MKKKWAIRVGITAALISTSALAVGVGGQLYVKAKNTKVMASTAPTANVVAVLQPGAQVTWMGADEKSPQWHRVIFGKKTGVVFQSNLSPNKPNMEIVASSGGREIDPQAFASSAAATKALSDGAIAYGEGTDKAEAVKQLIALEKLAAKTEFASHAKKAGIFVVVGDTTRSDRRIAGGDVP